MRNRLTITVSDLNGSKYYSVHTIIKKVLLYFVLFIFLVIFVGGVIIWFLSREVDSINLRKDTILKEYNKLSLENEKLAKEKEMLIHEIDARVKEYDVINEKMASLEEMMGLKPKDGADLIERVDTASITTLQKIFMLQVIPNGSPMKNGTSYTNSTFGWRMHPVLNKRSFHTGLDFKARVGDEVVATADGVIEFAGFDGGSGYGNMVLIRHNFGLDTMYAHLDSVNVRIGDFVSKGDVIGKSGNTGLSSGPHLHYEVRFLKVALNPTNFADWSIKNYNLIFEKEDSIRWHSLVRMVTRQLATQEQPTLQTGQK